MTGSHQIKVTDSGSGTLILIISASKVRKSRQK